MDGWNERLKQAREKRNFSQKDVTEMVNITQQSLIKYEQGKVFPKLDMILDLCECYSVSLNYIVYGNEEGISLENDLQKEITTLVFLEYLNKVDISMDGRSIRVLDSKLSRYLSCYVYFLSSRPKEDISTIEKLIISANKIKQ